MMQLDDSTWHGRIYSSGWVAGRGPTHTVVSPATGETLGAIGTATPVDVADAARVADVARRDWSARPYTERAAVLRRAGDGWIAHREEIVDWLMRESGAVRAMAEFQVRTSAEECYEAAALAAAPFGEVLRSHEPRLSIARRMPVGVVGVISPFNAPTILGIRAVAPALALGNAVVLKPDVRTAVTGGAIFAEIFAAAGLPDGLLHVVPGAVDVGEAVVADPLIPVIAFTGSTGAGRAVGALAARHLKRVHLELGGNSALIVLADVDLERATSVGAWGSFTHMGQVCMATSRHLVDARIVDDYVAALAARADRLTVGDPAAAGVALGPIIDEAQRERVHRIVTDTVADGARLAAGGTYEHLYYRPTVLADVPLTARAYQEEIFGPVAPVVPFASIEEAIALASDSTYGLSLGILTDDIGRALEIADRVPSGLVHINDQTVNDEATVPFGGVRDSGTGSRHGGAQANLDAFTDVQWLTIRGSLPTYPF